MVRVSKKKNNSCFYSIEPVKRLLYLYSLTIVEPLVPVGTFFVFVENKTVATYGGIINQPDTRVYVPVQRAMGLK